MITGFEDRGSCAYLLPREVQQMMELEGNSYRKEREILESLNEMGAVRRHYQPTVGSSTETVYKICTGLREGTAGKEPASLQPIPV